LFPSQIRNKTRIADLKFYFENKIRFIFVGNKHGYKNRTKEIRKNTSTNLMFSLLFRQSEATATNIIISHKKLTGVHKPDPCHLFTNYSSSSSISLKKCFWNKNSFFYFVFWTTAHCFNSQQKREKKKREIIQFTFFYSLAQFGALSGFTDESSLSLLFIFLIILLHVNALFSIFLLFLFMVVSLIASKNWKCFYLGFCCIKKTRSNPKT
jgi:hypothetical protein